VIRDESLAARLSRRRRVGALVGSAWNATEAVDTVTKVDNPLKSYPNREWE